MEKEENGGADSSNLTIIYRRIGIHHNYFVQAAQWNQYKGAMANYNALQKLTIAKPTSIIFVSAAIVLNMLTKPHLVRKVNLETDKCHQVFLIALTYSFSEAPIVLQS